MLETTINLFELQQ